MTTDQQKDLPVFGEMIVRNDRGLHTRPSTELVKCASAFSATIHLHTNDLTVNAKSLLGVLTLAASRGTRIRIEAVGEEAVEAVQALQNLAEHNFNMAY